MKAIIPVAGSGTRLRPLTHTKPKALLYVGSKPIIGHIVESLIPLGCDTLVFIIGPDGDAIPKTIKALYPDFTVESIVQHDRLGLGHAVSLAEEAVGDDDVLIIYGDTIIDGDLSVIRSCDVDGLIGVKEVEDPQRFGVVTIRDGLITGFVEKPSRPQSNLAIVGCNYFKNPAGLFESLHDIVAQGKKTKGEFQITDAFQLMIERNHKLKPFSVEGWFDCGTPESLLETNRYKLTKENRDISFPDSIIIPPVFVHESATVRHSIIGPYVSVGSEAFIERSIIADSIIGSGARVFNALFVRSLIGDYVEAAERPRRLIVGDDSILDIDVD